MKYTERMTAQYRLSLTLVTGVVFILSVAYVWRTQELRAALRETQKARVEVESVCDAEKRRWKDGEDQLSVSEARRIRAEMRYLGNVLKTLSNQDWNVSLGASPTTCGAKTGMRFVLCVFRALH